MNGLCNYLSVVTHFSSDLKKTALHCVDSNGVAKLDKSDTVEINIKYCIKKAKYVIFKMN